MLDQGSEDIFVLFKNSLPLYVFHDIGGFFEIEFRNADAAFSVLVCFGFEPPFTGHLTTREFRHQPTRHQETTSPPSEITLPPKI